MNNKNLGVSVGASRTLVHTNLDLRSSAFSGTYISHKYQVLCSPTITHNSKSYVKSVQTAVTNTCSVLAFSVFLTRKNSRNCLFVTDHVSLCSC